MSAIKNEENSYEHTVSDYLNMTFWGTVLSTTYSSIFYFLSRILFQAIQFFILDEENYSDNLYMFHQGFGTLYTILIMCVIYLGYESYKINDRE